MIVIDQYIEESIFNKNIIKIRSCICKRDVEKITFKQTMFTGYGSTLIINLENNTIQVGRAKTIIPFKDIKAYCVTQLGYASMLTLILKNGNMVLISHSWNTKKIFDKEMEKTGIELKDIYNGS